MKNNGCGNEAYFRDAGTRRPMRPISQMLQHLPLKRSTHQQASTISTVENGGEDRSEVRISQALHRRQGPRRGGEGRGECLYQGPPPNVYSLIILSIWVLLCFFYMGLFCLYV